MRSFAYILLLTLCWNAAAAPDWIAWCSSKLGYAHKPRAELINYGYTEAHFPQATRAKILDYDSRAFNAFAARELDSIASLFFTMSPKKVFDEVVKQYGRFLRASGKKHLNTYDRFGAAHGYSLVMRSSIGNFSAEDSLSTGAPGPKESLFQTTVQNIEKSYSNEAVSLRSPTFHKGQWHSVVPIEHTDLKGKSIEAGAILREDTRRIPDDANSRLEKSKIVFRLSYHKEGKQIFRDSLKRVESLDSKSWAEGKEEWANAARAFFIAMPLVSGSAGVGRLYFSALASRLSGRAVRLPADIDIFAITLNEKDFRDWLLGAKL